MESTDTESRPLEIAHVLFMDLVAYSRLPTDKQTRLIAQLNRVVRNTEQFRRSEAAGELLCSSTGDGMALVFFRDAEAAVRCALEIARALKDPPEVKLRMGVHTGPVYRDKDINDVWTVTGAGINEAQRVMDFGDAGHLLVSGSVAAILSQLTTYTGMLHDLGEFPDKHGQPVHLFNLYTEELGNPALPAKLQPLTATSLRVAILYKRHAEPDETLLKLLEAQLSDQGFEVFIDRHLTIGEEWAKEIARKVHSADAVIPLISAAALHSEMLAYEVQMAHEAAQQQNGKPRLLPVRVNFEGELPEPLAGILDPINYALWQSPADDDRLVDELVHALRAPLPPKPDKPAQLQRPAIPVEDLEPVGGAVPLSSPYYVFRPTDAEFLSAIARRDSIVLVKGARQMGKTSLLARGIQKARELGNRDVVTDFQQLNTHHLESLETFLLTVAESLAVQLDLGVYPDEVWNPRRSPNVNFEQYLRREVFGKLSTPLVWGMDEVDRLFTCGFGSEVFGLLRSWHNRRSLDPRGPWSQLTLAIAYATEAHLFIRDMNQSPFNVGTQVALEDFTMEQVQDLNQRYGSLLQSEAEVARYYRLVAGHPYLVRRGLHEMATRSLSLSTFEAHADSDEGPFRDHLHRLFLSLAQDEALCNAVRDLLRGRPCPSAEVFYRLRSSGVVTGDSAHHARPRCQVYESYLRKHLL